jgi:hypothetical protein
MAVNRLNVGATNQLLAKASSGQSTNILELQNTAGVTVAGVDANGNGVGGLAHPSTFKNLIINGAMQVAQRNTSVTGITGTGYNTADRWRTVNVTLGTWTQTVENDAPTGSGFRKSLKMLCTTADASPAAGDLLILHQLIEGQNLQQIAKGTSSAKELTLSFWVKSNVTGTYIVGINDSDNTRNISKSYTINASATWEKKTVIFAADTTGVLDNDNFVSLQTDFYLGAGSNWTSGTLGTSWASTTNANTAVGQTNLAAATNNYWQITGVQLEVGSVATDYEFKPFDVELQQCMRYYEDTKATSSPIFAMQAITNGLISHSFMVKKRATPTVKVYSSVTSVIDTVNNGNGNVQTNISGVNAYLDTFQVSMSGTTSQMYTYYYTASIEL